MLRIAVALALVLLVVGLLAAPRLLLPGDNDFRKLGWSEAFEKLHARLVLAYPFTEWKAIDWDALYARAAPRIAAAESSGDREAYYLALREYAYAIPDGHVSLGGEDFGLRDRVIGGGYGLAITGLDDGSVIAHVVLDEGPAAGAKVAWGAEILTWKGQPIAEAVAQTSTIWAEAPQATREGRRLEQYRYLVRDPVGAKASITFLNPDTTVPQTAMLVAEDDQMEPLKRTLPPERDPLTAILRQPVQAEILPSGYGYVAISGFMPTLGGLRPARIMDRAIESFVAQDVPGIVLDVRGNGGGLDALVPQLVGHFYDTPGFYEYISYYDDASGQFQIEPGETLTIEPRSPYYGGPVMVLVDKGTASTAEGPPLTIQRLPQGRVVGVHGTNGSFAMGAPGQDLYRLPEGIAFNFLAGRSLDASQVIQVDTNHEGLGGVVPDVRVPLARDTAYALYVEERDVVLETAIATLDETQQ